LFAPPLPQVELTDRNGVPLRALHAPDGSFIQPATYAEIPSALVQATVAAEDKRFWTHPGVDWRSSLRAFWGLVRYQRVISGGSTISQQLIKLAQPRPRTFRTKLVEAVQALRLEQVWNKQRILTEYLNRVDYANLNTGCATAAEFYFGKPLRDLSVAECALLAGLPQAPGRLNPVSHPDRARKRQQYVLARMREDGCLTAAEYSRAVAESVSILPRRRPFEAPHFVELVLDQCEELLPPKTTKAAKDRRAAAQPSHDAIAASNLNQTSSLTSLASVKRPSQDRPTAIRTTLDLELNRFAEQAVRRQIAFLAAQHVKDAAAVVIDNRSGGVLALVGSEDYFAPHNGQVNGAWAPRSAGSTFKPFTYLIAFEQGATPASIVADVPTEFATSTGLFAPANYDHRTHGPTRYRLALANSLNIAAVKVLASIGGPAVLQERLRACGLTTLSETPEHYGLGLTIGNAEARLLELANAYACLARLGEYRPYRLTALLPPSPAERGLGEGDLTSSSPVEPSDFGFRTSDFPQRLFDSSACYLLADVLSDNAARALEFGVESNLRFDFPVACKTGTSSDFRDNWAFGFTPEFTVGVWAGNFDGSPMQGISGVIGAAPILHELMDHLHERYGTSWYATPTNILTLPIHPVTGKRLALTQEVSRTATNLPAQVTRDLVSYNQGGRRVPAGDEVTSLRGTATGSALQNEAAILEKFVAGRLPPEESPDDFDAKGRIRLPAEYRDWLGTSDNWLVGRVVIDDRALPFKIIFPLPGTVFYLDPDLPESGGRIRLRAEGAPELEWQSDTLRCSRESGQSFAFLKPGQHRLNAVDPRTGQQRETWVQVLQR
jgi:penicillin-binding protein 1C